MLGELEQRGRLQNQMSPRNFELRHIIKKGCTFVDSAKLGEAHIHYIRKHTPCTSITYAAQMRSMSAKVYSDSPT